MRKMSKAQRENKRKVAIIGAGYVGASIAYALMIKHLAREMVLIDQDKNKAKGEAADIRHGIPYMGTAIIYDGGYEDCKDCDLIIITAGRNRKPKETRLDLIEDNTRILKSVYQGIKAHYTGSTIMVISNPVDIMTYKLTKWMDLPDGRVFGTGCILDTSRLISTVSDYVGINTEVIQGFVVGEHGDGQIPLWSKLSIAGIKIEEYCKTLNYSWGDNEKTIIEDKVKTMGAEIIKNKGRTHYGIATCVCELTEAILNKRPTVTSVTSVLQGEYGIKDVALSVPSIIGGTGVMRRLEEPWESSELVRLEEVGGKLKKVLRN